MKEGQYYTLCLLQPCSYQAEGWELLSSGFASAANLHAVLSVFPAVSSLQSLK